MGNATSYGALEPHIAAIMDWMQSLPADDISVRDQVPAYNNPIAGDTGTRVGWHGKC